MDYEKKYRDLVEAVKKLQEANPSDDGIQTWIKDNVPELKESEDERIRKALVEHCKEQADIYKTLQTAKEYGEIQSWIAWLEKQGTQYDDSNILQRFSFYSYKDEPNILYLAGVFVNENCRNKGIGTKILKVADDVASSVGCQVIRLKTQKDTDAYKLYIKNGYNVLTDEGNQVWLEKHGEQKETLCDKCRKEQPSDSCQDITALGRCALEYQDKQKSQSKSALEIWKDMRLEVYAQTSGNRHEPNCSDDKTKMFSLSDIDEIIEKISEQKPVEWHREDEQNLNACLGFIPDEYLRRWLKDVIHIKYDKTADKVEPKFKVGDWITG